MTADRSRPGPMSSWKTRAAVAGIGIALTTGISALVNLLTSSFSWTVAVILIALVLVVIAITAWERWRESADLVPGQPPAPAGAAAAQSVEQVIDRISPTGEAVGIDTAGELPSQAWVSQRAGTLEGHLTGIRIGRSEAEK